MEAGAKKHLKLGLVGAKLTTAPERPFVFLIYHLSGQEGKGNQMEYGTQ